MAALVAAGAQALAEQSGATAESDQESRLRRLEEAERARAAEKLASIRERMKPSFAAREARELERVAAIKARVRPIIDARAKVESDALAASAQATRDRVDQALGVMDYLSAFKDFSPERREQLGKKGHALPDGSFPIENTGDLSRAVKAYGRASDDKKDKVRRHIVKRARALGKPDAIPDSWSEALMSTVELFLADAKATA